MVQSPKLPAGYDEDYDESEPEQLDSLPPASAPAPVTSSTNERADSGGTGPVSPRVQADEDQSEEELPGASAPACGDGRGQAAEPEQQEQHHDEDQNGERENGGPYGDAAAVPSSAHSLPPRPVVGPPLHPGVPSSASGNNSHPLHPHHLPRNPSLAQSRPRPPHDPDPDPDASQSIAPTPSGSRLPPGMTYNPALHPPKRDLPVPGGLPGDRVADLDPEKYWTLRGHLNDLCGIGGTSRSGLPSFLPSFLPPLFPLVLLPSSLLASSRGESGRTRG